MSINKPIDKLTNKRTRLGPACKVAKQLAKLSVPVYMQTELIGVHYSMIKTAEQIEKQTALWRLALVYDAIANDDRRCFREVGDAYMSAWALDVAYAPPSCVELRVRNRAAWAIGAAKYNVKKSEWLAEQSRNKNKDTSDES